MTNFKQNVQGMRLQWIKDELVLAWSIPGMGEPGGLPSVGSHRVGHDWSDLAVAAVAFENHPVVVMEEHTNF